MPYKIITIALLTLTSLISVSCDGGSSGGDNNTSIADKDTTIADSLESSQLRTGDTLYFNSNNGTNARLDTLALNRTGVTEDAGLIYRYSKLGDDIFTIEQISTSDPQTRLDLALFNIFTVAPLGSRLRILIRRDTPNFTEAELNELVAILQPQGTNLAVADDGTLVTLNSTTHTCLVTSTITDRDEGTMGGPYLIQTSSFEMSFRRPTALELTRYRFISSSDWIPTVTSTLRPTETFETGTWNLELSSGLR